jgi:plasmid stability protein
MATLQIRNFPDDLKERLRARAERVDLTMSDYVIQLVRNEVERPTLDEMITRLEALPDHDDLPFTAADLIAGDRAERDEG